MKRIRRLALPVKAAQYLARRQQAADLKHKHHALDTTLDWKAARQTKSMGAVLATLNTMAGGRQRCMYCLDSHGSDIEHFRPKAPYPKRMYQWTNLLLCCTECGRFKGDQFPMAGRRVLLVDPTKENPWDSLDFDPVTGNICARFDVQSNAWLEKGEMTVKVLQLDQREALATGYLQTLRRLIRTVKAELAAGTPDAVLLMQKLKPDDDHGLLGWCFSDRGQTLQPFKDVHAQHPAVWALCCKTVLA